MINYRLGLLGYPLEHSLSPQLHRAILASLRLEGSYELFPIPPTREIGFNLQALLAQMRSGDLHGLNVTIPFKTTVIPYLDSLSPMAEVTGAVNAIRVKEGRLVGENYDCPAFIDDLTDWMHQIGRDTNAGQVDRLALVLGAGGAARAVVYGLLSTGWEVILAARRVEQAEELARAYCDYQALTICRLDESDRLPTAGIDLIVNATPLGMYPNSSASPWPGSLALPQGALVYDLVYNPPETSLLGLARSAGLPAANGLGMLVRQAAMSLAAWTGRIPDWQPVYRSLLAQRASI